MRMHIITYIYIYSLCEIIVVPATLADESLPQVRAYLGVELYDFFKMLYSPALGASVVQKATILETR